MGRPKQSRTFQGIIYPDAQNYSSETVLELLPTVFSEYAFALHDKDLDDSGNLKKPHIHWLGRRDSPSLLSTISNALGVPQRDIEYCKNFRFFLRYLIHLDHPSRYQYNPEIVQGNFNHRILFGDSEQHFVMDAISAMDSQHIRSIRQLAFFACQQGSWTDFRRNYSILKDIMHEMSVSDISRDWEGVKNSDELPFPVSGTGLGD